MTDTTTTTMADLMAMEPEDFAAALDRIWPRRISSPTMPSSESVLNIAGALAKAQGEFPPIPRDRTVTVRMKPKDGQPAGSYTFTYAPLSTIREKTRPALAAAGLAILQAIIAEPAANGGVVEVLRTTLVHSSGEWLACDVPMFHGTGDNRAQAYNSGATYARRLGVTLLLCIAADEDDDGNGGDQTSTLPDYERQEATTYRGSFPRQGGGQSNNRQQGGNGPRAPQRRQGGQAPAQRREDPPAQQAQHAAPQDDDPPFQDDDLPDFGLAQFQGGGDGVSDAVQHDGDGVVTTPWGDGLTAGQLSMAKSRASVAGLTDAQVLELTGPITPANVSDALATLKRAADAALDA